MSIKQLIESGGDLSDVGNLVDPGFNEKLQSHQGMILDDGTRPLTPSEMRQWNKFLDYVKDRGYEGSEELNKRDKGLGAKLFAEFKQKNPGVTIDYDIVPSVQEEMQKLKENVQGFARRHGNKNADNLMANVSPVDGWFGSKTSQFRFPEMEVQQYHNDELVNRQNLGLVDSSMRPVEAGSRTDVAQSGGSSTNVSRGTTEIPKGAKIEKLKDGYYYEDPKSGDMIKFKDL